ncbi:MAG: hypothetical protein QXP01_08970, partial [Candidatus Hadarchaeum sp.]
LLLAASFCLSIYPGWFFISRDVALFKSFPASRAELASLDGGPFNVSASSADSRAPALAVWEDIVHIVWEERGRVYHRFCRGGTWSSIYSVATGEQPDIVVGTSGMAHVVLVNEFGGNYEIYYCRWNGTTWSLPRNVSNTSGVSSSPAIAVAPNGILHVVWADNTPGYNIIYHAYWNGVYWLNEPIPNALGGAPAIAVDMDGVVHVVWQDRDTPSSPYEIYYSRWDGANWSLPENLSDSATEQSIIPSVAVDGSSEAHVLWQERINSHYTIYYTWGRVGIWSIPERVSEDEVDAYLPSVAVAPGSIIYAGWDESTLILYRKRIKAYNSPWWEPTLVVSDTRGVADVQLTVGANGQLHAVWNNRVAAGNWDVFYQCLSVSLFLPIMLKGSAS